MSRREETFALPSLASLTMGPATDGPGAKRTVGGKKKRKIPVQDRTRALVYEYRYAPLPSLREAQRAVVALALHFDPKRARAEQMPRVEDGDHERLQRAGAHAADANARIMPYTSFPPDLAGDGDHYAARVVSESFRGMSRVAQQRAGHQATAELILCDRLQAGATLDTEWSCQPG